MNDNKNKIGQAKSTTFFPLSIYPRISITPIFQRWNEMREQETSEEMKKRQNQQLNQFYSTLSKQKVNMEMM